MTAVTGRAPALPLARALRGFGGTAIARVPPRPYPAPDKKNAQEQQSMSSLPSSPTSTGTGALTSNEAEAELRALIDGGFRALRAFPPRIEQDFQRHQRARLLRLLRTAMPWLFALHALVVVPALMFRADPSLRAWLLFGTAPLGSSLAFAWLASRLDGIEAHLDVVGGVGLFACLIGPLYCAMALDGQYFGQFAKYETVYVVIAAFTILQLPVRVAMPVALATLMVALAAAVMGENYPFWLEVVMYFVGPLAICASTGYALEHAERRNFLQTRLLHLESQRLAGLHAAAEAHLRAQQFTADYLELINGSLSLKELFTRTLRHLAEHCGAEVGVAYHLNARGRLRRVATWAVAAEQLDDKRELEPGATLVGPALAQGEPLHLTGVRADYLRLELGLGSLPCAEVLILPVLQGGKALAAIELGRVTPFTAEQLARANAIRTHLAYAVAAANAREIGLRAAIA